MVNTKINFFIDTNIFIDYILLKENKDEIEENHPLYNILKPSFDLLDFYFENQKKIRLCTSFLNICEMPAVLIESLVRGRMYIKNISFNYFETYLSRFQKQKRFSNEIKDLLEEYYEFLEKKEIWFIHKLTVERVEDFKEIDNLKIKFRVPTIDSLIFFIAKTEKGYFVTNDSHHFLDNKRLKEAYKKDITITSPNEALKIMKETLNIKSSLVKAKNLQRKNVKNK